MHRILAGGTGFNPFSSAAALGVKGLVCIGLVVLAAVVVLVFQRPFRNAFAKWFGKDSR